MFQTCTSLFTSSTEQKQAQPEATPVVMTAAEKAANDADWEAKQAEIAAQQKAEAEEAKRSQRFAACTEMDKGGWPDRIGEVNYCS